MSNASPRFAKIRAIVRTTGEHFVLIDTLTFSGSKHATGPIFTDTKDANELFRDRRYCLGCAFVFDASNLPAEERAKLDFRIGNSRAGGVNCLDAAKRFRAAGAKVFKARFTRPEMRFVFEPMFARKAA